MDPVLGLKNREISRLRATGDDATSARPDDIDLDFFRVDYVPGRECSVRADLVFELKRVASQTAFVARSGAVTVDYDATPSNPAVWKRTSRS